MLSEGEPVAKIINRDYYEQRGIVFPMRPIQEGIVVDVTEQIGDCLSDWANSLQPIVFLEEWISVGEIESAKDYARKHLAGPAIVEPFNLEKVICDWEYVDINVIRRLIILDGLTVSINEIDLSDQLDMDWSEDVPDELIRLFELSRTATTIVHPPKPEKESIL